MIFGCKTKSKKINFVFENSSEIRNIIYIDLYINEVFYKKFKVEKQNIDHKFIFDEIKIPSNQDKIKLTFKITETTYISKLNIDKSLFENKDYVTVHVNLKEIIFHEGDYLGVDILSKDSIVKKEFYSEIVPR